MPKAKQARPPPDNTAQSERFLKDAADLITPDGVKSFERALQSIARPALNAPIIGASKTGKKKPAKKSGSTD